MKEYTLIDYFIPKAASRWKKTYENPFLYFGFLCELLQHFDKALVSEHVIFFRNLTLSLRLSKIQLLMKTFSNISTNSSNPSLIFG